MWTARVPDRYWTRTEPNGLEMDNEQITAGKLSVGYPFTILSMHKTPQWTHRTSTDTNVDVTGKTDMDGRVPDDQWINVYGTHQLSIPSTPDTMTGVLMWQGLSQFWTNTNSTIDILDINVHPWEKVVGLFRHKLSIIYFCIFFLFSYLLYVSWSIWIMLFLLDFDHW